MAVQATTSLFIGSKKITNFKSYTLDQFINDHHILEVICRMDVLDQLEESLANSSKNFLGQSISLEVISDNLFENYKPLQFTGVVVKIASRKGMNDRNEVVITAYSPTIIADDGPHYASYCDTSLDDIVSTSFQEYDQSKLKTTIQAQNTGPILYSVQHNESNWQYISRLARQYGEWLYYNGQNMIFGTPEDTDELVMTQGKDLYSFAIELIPLPNRFNFFTGDYTADTTHEKRTDDVSTGANGYNSFASNVSQGLYAKETRVWVNQVDSQQQRSQLDQQVELRKKAIEQQQFSVEGESNNPGVRVGQKINITTEGLSEGNYRVTKVRHFNTSNGNYQNTFEAVSTQLDVFPDTNLMAHPKSDSQIAIVTDNADPEGLSRIKVQFAWQQEDGEMTSWLRMLTPHSGGEKGFHFIPEIGEEVLVGFEGGNAERPYVMGALYNGSKKAGEWQSGNNDVKAIRTRSGHTIELNDANGAEFITITDKNSNTIHIDTANNNIEVTALENMTFNAKNIRISAEENIEVSAGNDFTKSVGENYNVITKNKNVIVEETLSLNSAKQENVSDDITLSSNKEDLTLASGKTVDVQSTEKVKLF
ncbi:type VI secretion system Vgr family protein [Aquimarina pacifica]|uniref:type VI secretion system Vgr family protein n=1 Tax=Aquimarina pacifica TaxID=1296415 RepID=UPI000552EC3B|nr:phage baseplate assembly protein V [Aquimarina pacifica]